MNRVAQLQRIGLACFAAVALNLGRLQVTQGGWYHRLAEQNHLRLVPSGAPRGRILDRTGLILAGNRPALDVVIVPQETNVLPETLLRLGRILDRAPERLLRTYQARRTLPFAPVVVAEDIPRETAIRIEEQRQQLPGVFIQPRALRTYPEGASATHAVGYIGEIAAGELASFAEYGYRRSDDVGKTGIERQYDAYLRGEPGGTMVEVDHRGRFVRLRGVREATPGKDVQLTISAWLQRLAARLLGDLRGACVLLDPHTGEVLALVSTPSFDPNLLLQPETAPKRAILAAPQAPMLDRTCHGFTPGSVFKIVTALAALESRHITPATSVLCQGALVMGRDALRCWKRDGHGPEDVRLALRHSCNVYFGQVGLWTGPELLHAWATDLGVGRPTGIELPDEEGGLVPGPSTWWDTRHWFAGHTAQLAIGQGQLLVTPLQMAVLMAAVANGGWVARPHLVKAVGGLTVAGSSARHVPVSPETLATVIQGLDEVVNAPDGTGHRAHSARLHIAGKTGTAQTEQAGHPHGWFVGYAPVENPRLVVVVFVEYGGSGGDRPSDIARQLFEAWALTQAPGAPASAVAARDGAS